MRVLTTSPDITGSRRFGGPPWHESEVVPAIERLGQWRTWLKLARELSAVVLQTQVSAALQAAPRGREPSQPGERFRRMVLAAMPDIEAMEVVERFFEIGARAVETGHPIAIFLAGCRECLAEWEVQVAHGRMAGLASARRSSAEEGAPAAGEAVQRGDAAEASRWPVCSRG